MPKMHPEITSKILALFYSVSKDPTMACVSVEMHPDFVRIISEGSIHTVRDIPLQLFIEKDLSYFVAMAGDLAADRLKA